MGLRHGSHPRCILLFRYGHVTRYGGRGQTARSQYPPCDVRFISIFFGYVFALTIQGIRSSSKVGLYRPLRGLNNVLMCSAESLDSCSSFRSCSPSVISIRFSLARLVSLCRKSSCRPQDLEVPLLVSSSSVLHPLPHLESPMLTFSPRDRSFVWSGLLHRHIPMHLGVSCRPRNQYTKQLTFQLLSRWRSTRSENLRSSLIPTRTPSQRLLPQHHHPMRLGMYLLWLARRIQRFPGCIGHLSRRSLFLAHLGVFHPGQEGSRRGPILQRTYRIHL